MMIGSMPGGPAFWNYMEERWCPKSWDDIWTVIAITSRVPWKVYGMGPHILETLYHWSKIVDKIVATKKDDDLIDG
jgi:hypothetical protein